MEWLSSRVKTKPGTASPASSNLFELETRSRLLFTQSLDETREFGIGSLGLGFPELIQQLPI